MSYGPDDPRTDQDIEYEQYMREHLGLLLPMTTPHEHDTLATCPKCEGPAAVVWTADRICTACYGDELRESQRQVEELRAAIRKCTVVHRGCEDGFYACPKSEDYFGEWESTPIDERPCGCWVEELRAALAASEAHDG